MERTPIESSTIKSIGHAGTILEVEFKSGTIYQYKGVQKPAAKKLMDAKSIGAEFGRSIRDNYPHIKIRG
jgi:hypothetical protein